MLSKARTPSKPETCSCSLKGREFFREVASDALGDFFPSELIGVASRLFTVPPRLGRSRPDVGERFDPLRLPVGVGSISATAPGSVGLPFPYFPPWSNPDAVGVGSSARTTVPSPSPDFAVRPALLLFP
jgi:hypothetical protein